MKNQENVICLTRYEAIKTILLMYCGATNACGLFKNFVVVVGERSEMSECFNSANKSSSVGTDRLWGLVFAAIV